MKLSGTDTRLDLSKAFTSKIEFVSRIQEALHHGQIFSMSELQTIYGNIEEANGVQDTGIS